MQGLPELPKTQPAKLRRTILLPTGLSMTLGCAMPVRTIEPPTASKPEDAAASPSAMDFPGRKML